MAETGLPLEGVRVIEMTHMVMGPTCGMILGDLGAEVIKVEPPGGDKTRTLGRPLRAGSSVNDIMGGMFGAIGALAALTEREHTGRGQDVQVGLFENCVFLSAQHMLQYALTGVAAPPMPDRINAWGVFDLFETSDGEQVFLGVVTDTQWAVFGRAFDLGSLAADPRLASNTLRVQARPWMLPQLREIIKKHSARALQDVFEREGLPYAPIVKPEQLYDDPHLKASGGLGALTLVDGRTTPVPLLPLLLDGRHLKPRMPLPKVGEHDAEV